MKKSWKILRHREIDQGWNDRSNISNQNFKNREKFIFEEVVAEDFPEIRKTIRFKKANKSQKG